MVFFLISVLAGVLTVLAPCILPLLPIVIGASEKDTRHISKRAFTVIGSLSLSVIFFTLLLKATTLFISIPQSFWAIFSGVVIILVGIMMLFPDLWAKIPIIKKLNSASNKALGAGYQKNNYRGDMAIGLALGPVFTTCSPTYLFIIATVLPAGFWVGFVYLIGFTIGLAASLLAIAYFGQQITNTLAKKMTATSKLKKVFGALIIVVGLLVLTGFDKKLETAILDSGYGATINFEENLIERFAPQSSSRQEPVSLREADTVSTPDEAAQTETTQTNLVQGSIQNPGSEISLASASDKGSNQILETETEADQGSLGSEQSSALDQNSASTAPSATDPSELETLTLAGGCFWCTEAYLQVEEGVISAVSGYAGGTAENATYLQVANGQTQHREAVQVTFDPAIISAEEILDTFWGHIDPTDAGGQFADRGSHYTTAIYYANETQRALAEDSKARLENSGLFTETIATEILSFTTFFQAEEYHQDYFLKASDHYERYKKASGRAGFVEGTWARDAAIAFFEQESQTVPASLAQFKQSDNDYNYTDEEIEELLKNLDPLAYHVVAENGTEAPFNNAYWDNKADGIYVDIVTGKPLFSSTHKYDSGTGWPSFWRTIDDDSVTMHADNSLSIERTEIRSEGGHVGHVFEDGPIEEGGRRFCTNSASLSFVPKAEMAERGYAQYLHFFE